MEERDTSLAGQCPSHQGLAGPGRSHEQDAPGRLGAEFLVVFRMLKKSYQLRHFALGGRLPGDVVEGDLAG